MDATHPDLNVDQDKTITTILLILCIIGSFTAFLSSVVLILKTPFDATGAPIRKAILGLLSLFSIATGCSAIRLLIHLLVHKHPVEEMLALEKSCAYDPAGVYFCTDKPEVGVVPDGYYTTGWDMLFLVPMVGFVLMFLCGCCYERGQRSLQGDEDDQTDGDENMEQKLAWEAKGRSNMLCGTERNEPVVSVSEEEIEWYRNEVFGARGMDKGDIIVYLVKEKVQRQRLGLSQQVMPERSYGTMA